MVPANGSRRGRGGSQAAGAAHYNQQMARFGSLGGGYAPGPPKYFSIDVECVATGTDHNARGVGQISLVDEYERVLLNIYVKPEAPVASYLSPLTGLSREVLEKHGVPLATAMQYLRSYLPPYAVLVGQSIGKDVGWLSLREGVDFESMVDLAGLYRIWNAAYNSVSVFSLDHLAKVLLGYNSAGGTQPHNAVSDALKSMQLFNYYRQVRNVAGMWKSVEAALLAAPVDESFAKRHPCFEGVCMGNRKKCTCGAPFLG
ncbi:unnamed protein product [Ostreobium quekettii]|uniref:Exonuclease domain-containing protein n=1 Tax=Ostreobium quekettii TaxID=121088 RepID=A0A8S1J7V4_9CHLO|nr:unnamed protein product [Ostreobium quekettii]|eukprot:evm.model.scf_243.3 EVM.evm.TU.scf_243.3   scf_243:8775-9993(+)